MERKWRAAVIACGRMARAHGNAYAALPNVELVACADIMPEALDRWSEMYGIPKEHTYLDYCEMLEKEQLDLISIVSLHDMHAEMTIEAARRAAPKGILVEKPIALNLGQADAMMEACAKAGTTLIVGHQRSYTSQYRAAMGALKAGAIGELRSLESHGHPGSSLLVDGTHTVDLLRRYAGNVAAQWVFGQIDMREGRSAWGSHVENAAMFMIGFENGLRALHTCGSGRVGEQMQALWPAVTGPNYHFILLRGTEGEIWIDGDAPTEGIPLVRLVKNGKVEAIPLPKDEEPGHVRIVRDLINSIETGAEHPLNAQHARETLEILMAAFESSRQRQFIGLPLESKGNALFDMLGTDK